VRAPRLLIVRARPGYDTVLDAARELIVRAVAADGGVVHGASAGDLAAVPADIDAVIVIGGTGSGRNDRIVRTLARVGRLEVHGIALAPGETAAFGFAQERPVLLLPGRLDAALAVWLVLGRPMLARLSCAVESAPPLGTRAVLARKVASLLSMTELVPVRCTGQKAEPIASGYWPLQAIAQANGWILVPADSEGYPAGAEVVVRPWP
jgi:molybdopterin biosynthesis enzyme